MDKLKNITIFILFIVIGILLTLRQCESKPEPNVFTKTIIKIDTVQRPYKVISFKTRYYPKWDTARLTDTIWNADLCNFERDYTDSFPDSNITIFSNITTVGLLKSNKVSYRLKVPLIIKETHEYHDTKTVPNKWDLYINGGLGGNVHTLGLNLGATFRYKKVTYGYFYNIVDKTHNIELGYRILKSKK